MKAKGCWEVGLGKAGTLNRIVREHLTDDERASTQKGEAERSYADLELKLSRQQAQQDPEMKYALHVQSRKVCVTAKHEQISFIQQAFIEWLF